MTNVPQNIREAWADVYKLFDVSYGMTGSQEDWEQYWKRVTELIQKYGDNVPLLEIFEAVAHMIETFVKQRDMPTWSKDEDYPYPEQ